LNLTSSVVALVGISLNSGSVVSVTRLPFTEEVFVGVGQFVAADSTNGDVYVAGRMASAGNNIQVFRVRGGTVSPPIATLPATIDVLGGASTLDPVNHIMILEVAVNTTEISIQFALVNVNTGSVTFVQNPNILESLNFDPKSGLIYGFGLDVSTGQLLRTVVTLNAATKVFNVLGRVNIPPIISADVTAFDPVNRILYGFFSQDGSSNFELDGVNVASLQVVSNPDACPNDAACPWSIEYYLPS